MILQKWPEAQQQNNMMKYPTITLALLLFFSSSLFAQHAHFTTSGTIEFEKKVNMYAVIQRMITKDNEAFFAPIFDTYKKGQPQFKSFKSTFLLRTTKFYLRQWRKRPYPEILSPTIQLPHKTIPSTATWTARQAFSRKRFLMTFFW